MTDPTKHLDNLEALLARATKELWTIWGLSAKHAQLTLGVEKDGSAYKHIASMAWRREEAAPQDGVTGYADAALIAALKNDAAALIACARELRPLLAILEGPTPPAAEMFAAMSRAKSALNLLGGK